MSHVTGNDVLDEGVMAARSRSRSGWVFGLSNQSLPGMVKIGHTRKDLPDERCRSISRYRNPTADGSPFVLEFAEAFDDCLDGERGVHYLLDAHRVFDVGFELFAVSVGQAREAVLKVKALGPSWKPEAGSLVQTKRADTKRIGRRASRHRNPYLYAWLMANHDRLKPLIGSCRSENDDVFWRLRCEWLDSLPETYQGKQCSPLGLMLEWQRVAREIELRDGYGERAVRWELRDAKTLSNAGE